MDLYKMTGFLRFFLHYFIDAGAGSEESVNVLRGKAASLVNASRLDPQVWFLDEWIAFLEKSGFAGVHAYRYEGWQRLKKELPSLSTRELGNLYAVLYGIINQNTISVPAQEILQDFYPDIVLEVVRDGISPVIDDKKDAARFADAVNEAFADYVLAYCAPEDIAIWGEDYEDPFAPATQAQADEFDDGYGQISCFVVVTDAETVERMKHAAHAEWYYSSDVDGSISFPGNLITFTTKQYSDAVTLQITGRTSFDTYGEMFSRVGTEAFGYKEKTPADCAKAAEERFEDYGPEGAMALRVKKLPQPLLSKADLAGLKAELCRNREPG